MVDPTLFVERRDRFGARRFSAARPNVTGTLPSTMRIVASTEYRDLGTAEVKGLDAPVAVWQVVRPSTVESRFEALRAANLSPLIGRDA